MIKQIVQMFPRNIGQAIETALQSNSNQLEEIRLRLNREIELNFSNKVVWIPNSCFSEKDCIYVLNQLSEYSLYRLEDELREGYITIKGGHRVGLAGEVTTENGKLKHIQKVTFFNIRIARELPGIFTPYLELIQENKRYCNTLIIGAPQSGKTTLLRDIARLISDGTSNISSSKVGIIDERSEIAACMDGAPQHNIGRRTDVLDACPKVEGMMMMIRSMSPEVLIVDEIGKEADAYALMEAIYAGVTIICTAHGRSIDELKQRPSFKLLFESGVFQRYIVIKKNSRKEFMTRFYNQSESEIPTYGVLRK